MSNQAKMIRGQMRQIVKELLPDMVEKELRTALHEKLASEVQKRLDNVTKSVKEVLETIDQRSKEIQGYLVRQSSTPMPPAAQPLAPEEAPKTE